MTNTVETDKAVKELEQKKLQLAQKIAELKAEARKLDVQLHAAGGSEHVISCW